VRSANDDVTVVISCFNYGAYLDDALRSLEAQEDGPPRVIVVDDGSTDPATIDVLDRLEDRAVVIRQRNKGAAMARNNGLEEVDTAFALVLDADDQLVPNAIAVLKRALDDNPSAGYAYGHIEFFGGQEGVMRMPQFDPWRLIYRHIIGPTALMRQEMVKAIGGYDPTYGHYEDWEIWLHALADGWQGVQVPQSILLYRKHGSSKYDSDRAAYRDYFGRLRAKHRALYGDLRRVREQSDLGFGERQLYRWVWGYRPWPRALESALYSQLWRRSRSTQTTER
jgi:glycosyltransferase involved in cell wall biosynthesis